MSEERNPRDPSLSPEGIVAKRPWHPPEMQEVDVVETELGSGNYQPADFGTYLS